MGHRLILKRTHRSTVAPEALWPYLSDTDSLNRALGLPPVRYSPTNHEGEPVLLARARQGPFELEWLEYPFEWSYARRYAVRRVFRMGPFTTVSAGVELNPGERGGTEIEAFAAIEFSSPAGWLAAQTVVARQMGSGLRQAIARIEKHLASGGRPFADRAYAATNEPALSALLQRLQSQGVAPRIAERMGSFLREAADRETRHIRPFALADAWGFPRYEVLDAFFEATRIGLVELSWEVLCPLCRQDRAAKRNLDDVRGRAHCDLCRIDFEAEFDRHVELKFAVHPAVRRSAGEVYCIGGPQNTPHVVAQVRLGGREERNLRIPDLVGGLALRVSPGRAGLDLPAAGITHAPVKLAVRRDRLQWEGERPSARPAALTAGNEESLPLRLILERDAWDAQIVTAAIAATRQRFRDVFSTELLAAGEELAVRSMAILFTDLRGSTALYREAGDPAAYARVSAHFEALKEILARHEGAFIKTAGDAVMGAFIEPENALKAALEMLRACTRPEMRGLVLKVALNAGPCIAATHDGAMDFFGTAVNLAARLLDYAGPNELITTEEFYARASAAVHAALKSEPFSATPKGFDQVISLVRLRP